MRESMHRSSTRQAELWATLALRHCKGIGATRAKYLVDAFGSPLAAVEAILHDASAWVEHGRVIPDAVQRQFIAQHWRERAKQEWDAIRQGGHTFLLWADDAYPFSLRQLPDAPLMLYYKGDVSLLAVPAVGVVGSRNCTQEGMGVAAFLSRGLSQAGVTVISGMAKGIDRVAHLAALEEVGRSIAVLGTGINEVYPLCNSDLEQLLASKGLIVSEFSPDTKASSAHFPIRNRIISGLSYGILVVEAAGRSGTLITARLALEQGKDVFAVPGHTTAAVSQGCRELIRQGAKPVFSADDILLELAPQLSMSVQKQLQQRIKQQKKGTPVPDAEVDGGVLLLPQRDIPWAAPLASKQLRQTAKKQDIDAGCCPQEESVCCNVEKLLTKDDLLPQAVITTAANISLSIEEQRVMEALTSTVQHIDVISRLVERDVAHVSVQLLLLEMKGLIVRQAGMLYALRG